MFLKEGLAAAIPIHPGQLKELGMSAAELARNLAVSTNRITGILHTALRLAHFFGRARSSG